MTRSVTAALLTAAGAGATQPVYFVEIAWPTFSTRLCSYSTQTWNGNVWSGGGFELGDFDDSGRPARLTLADPDVSYRTLVLTDGIRDRQITVWKSDVSAIDVADPVLLFRGYADKADMASGRVIVGLDRNTSSRQFAPRERIGPAIGVNFVAPPGYVLRWGAQQIVFEAR